jgi:hypothetical protein
MLNLDCHHRINDGSLVNRLINEKNIKKKCWKKMKLNFIKKKKEGNFVSPDSFIKEEREKKRLLNNVRRKKAKKKLLS